MFVVALAELATSVEEEALILAEDLGKAVYEARILLSAGVPCVVLTTPDRDRALDLLGKLRGRGHGVVAFDARAVIPASSMIAVRRYRLGKDALELDVSDVGEPPLARLPFSEMSALLCAVHRSSRERVQQVKEVKFRPAAAIATGGLILTKSVNKKVRSTIEEREDVLYVFQKTGVPWLLRESTARPEGLGEAMHNTRALNFAAHVRMLRERAPHAEYDARLVALKRFPEPPLDDGEARRGDRATGGVDLLAHVLALWMSRKGK
jgi:hypothetical protein